MTDKIPVKNVTPEEHQGPELYAKRNAIYTRSFTGLFRNVRISAGVVLFVLFLGTVWLQWNGRQAVWWNLPERKFYIFGATFWPQDFVLLAWLLIICAFGLFFITVFAGRVWCGYACPQSVWTWIFMWVEKITEGDRNQRMKLDKAPMSANKFLRKFAKHSLWLLIGLGTGLTFVGYFTPIRELPKDLLTGQASGWAYFWVSFFTFFTYLFAGWLREQVCIYMCPYSRFQSVMFDKDTLIVSYDEARGEKRGPRKKGADYQAQGLGDCIDCKLCVHVCPTGIDIRDGLQIACIGCAACVDACDSIMEKMGYEPGLVSYTTEHNLSGKKTKVLRPRLIGYALALTAMASLFTYTVINRPLVEFNVIKDRTQFRENRQGRIENVYTLVIINKAQTEHSFKITAEGLPGIQLEGRSSVKAAEGELLSVPVSISVAPEDLPSSANEITFHVEAEDDATIKRSTSSRFLGPAVLR
ncbi:(Fe-S)-binding protein [Thiopseudomonas alkaliphila]|uniref:cytochrome c oxidase accessory protein CcoG n=1 Tax=Thiopseudomonas alkaliphila TaxID=1697053 RepID=UPI00069E8690|nr:cytochrome c oxidase accessory protein CcoG [Thiopseudomonas alkaliphila]AKX44493.1 (Fe-S)-binding protein [Thiopseudomonas alkaliphila]AKX52324.1 (Fe-S)-binding protein [Thiopseudomonas alkaliphila]